MAEQSDGKGTKEGNGNKQVSQASDSLISPETDPKQQQQVGHQPSSSTKNVALKEALPTPVTEHPESKQSDDGDVSFVEEDGNPSAPISNKESTSGATGTLPQEKDGEGGDSKAPEGEGLGDKGKGTKKDQKPVTALPSQQPCSSMQTRSGGSKARNSGQDSGHNMTPAKPVTAKASSSGSGKTKQAASGNANANKKSGSGTSSRKGLRNELPQGSKGSKANADNQPSTSKNHDTSQSPKPDPGATGSQTTADDQPGAGGRGKGISSDNNNSTPEKRSAPQPVRNILVKLHTLFVPEMWKMNESKVVGIATQRNWNRVHPCSSTRPIDKTGKIVDVVVELHFSKEELAQKFLYKYCVSEPDQSLKFEDIGNNTGNYTGQPTNRVLDPVVHNMLPDPEGECFHHYDGCIIPQESYSAFQLIKAWFGQGQSLRKSEQELRCESLRHYLKNVSNGLQENKFLDTLSSSPPFVVNAISSIYNQIKNARVQDGDYMPAQFLPRDGVFESFKDFIVTVLFDIQKSLSSESPELAAKVQVAGCALLAIVSETNILSSLNSDFREALVLVLNCPPSADKEWLGQYHHHLQSLLPNPDAAFISNREKFSSRLWKLWLDVAKGKQIHFRMLPLFFYTKGCFQPFEKLSVPVDKMISMDIIRTLKETRQGHEQSVKDCLPLIESLYCPSLSPLVLFITPLRTWTRSDLLVKFPLCDTLEYLNGCVPQRSGLEKEETVKKVGECIVLLASSLNDRSLEVTPEAIKAAFKIAAYTLTVESSITVDTKEAQVYLCLQLCSLSQKPADLIKFMEYLCNQLVVGINAYNRARSEKENEFGGSGYGFQEFKLWSRMLSIEARKPVTEAWHTVCKAVILKRFHRASMEKKVSIMNQGGSLDSEALEKILAENFLQSLEKMDERNMNLLFAGGSHSVRSVFAKYLNRKYPNRDSITFEDLCKWSLWPQCFKVFLKASYTEGQHVCEQAQATLLSVIDAIESDEISVEDVRTICQNRKNFGEMTSALDDCSGKVADIMAKVQGYEDFILHNECDVQQLLSIVRQSRTFMTNQGQAECSKLQEFCDKNIETLSLKALARRRIGNSVVTLLLPVASPIHILFKENKSDVTAKLWQRKGYKVDSYETLVNTVWPEFYTHLKDTVEKLKSLDIPCAEAFALLPAAAKGPNSELLKLVHALEQCEHGSLMINESGKWVDDIMSKIEVYKSALVASDGARMVLEVKKALWLTGDFAAAEEISQGDVCLGQKLLSDDNFKGLRINGIFLRKFSKFYDCLLEVGRCQELVHWIQTLGDASQLQTFTNIALITQCEDASSVDRLTALEAVGTILGPIIFTLPQDSGLRELMTAVGKIEVNPEAVMNQMNTCRGSFEWYKRIQATLGSVEETAYGQLADLTEAGKYTIFIPEGKIPDSIKELVKVEIVERATPKKGYSLEDLKDLQSKLALIKGKISKKDFSQKTDTYWQGLELTVRIASCLLDLLKVGHMKYKTIDYSYSLTAENILDKLKKQAKEMEDDLENWCTEIKRLRSKYYSLNFFTARQLSIICQQLSICGSHSASLDPWFLNLLESISPSVSEQSVRSALEEMFTVRDRRRERDILGINEQEPEPEAEAAAENNGSILNVPAKATCGLTVDDLTDEQREIYDEMEALDHDPELILLGLDKFGENYDKVEEFCLESASGKVEENADLDIGEVSKSSDNTTIPIDSDHPDVQVVLENGYSLDLAIEAVRKCSDVIDALDYCMDKDQATDASPQTDSHVESSFVLPFTMNVREEDLWIMEDVGTFLARVADKEQENAGKYFPEEREFKLFLLGTPNVLVVPRGDIFHLVLSLYMHSPKLPLPTAEEVLCCHANSTAEDIRLLWMRAVGDPDKNKIFCLVCEYNLTYKVAKEAVQDLRELQGQGNSDFKLVIVVCKEDEQSSLLLGDLRDYRRSVPPLPSRSEVSEYLKHHFIHDVVKFGPDLREVGASADSEKSFVRVVTASKAGMGKSLYIQRLCESFKHQHACLHQVVPLHGPDINSDIVVKELKRVQDPADQPVVYHLDISERIADEVDSILFNMLILRAVQDSQGSVWRCNLKNLYTVEVVSKTPSKLDGGSNVVKLLDVLPTAKCLSPTECLKLLDGDASPVGPSGELLVGMDELCRVKESYQRVYQYLCRFGQSVDQFTFEPNSKEGTASEWIEKIMTFFDLPGDSPSWTELYRFAAFLDAQLKASERSIYCDESIVGDARQGVSGFKSFVVKFMIRMSVDFTVPSLQAAYQEEDREEQSQDQGNMHDDLSGYQIVQRRGWENSVHPYIFFNRDKTRRGKDDEAYDSMTFIGFNFQAANKRVSLRGLNGKLIEDNIMPYGLYNWLQQSRVEMQQKPHCWEKTTILEKLFHMFDSNMIMVDSAYYRDVDPDPTYALTYDNLVKMLAIQMRFRCGIPVVVMGETGCGKTRLIRYMCQLQAKFMTEQGKEPRQTFFMLKVHGGTTEETIVSFVETVQEEARNNSKLGLQTVLFFDEANTTDGIGLIKEIMCDQRMKGKPIDEEIKFIAACNPYRKHSEEMIEKLEHAGLGFCIDKTKTKQKLGSTPLRHLVYRVLELPSSMKPLVYDYGSLNTDTEQTYIRRITENHVSLNPVWGNAAALTKAISRVLSWAQDYMRGRKDECSYVSLRDVERCMVVFKWFSEQYESICQEMVSRCEIKKEAIVDQITFAMIMSIAICYGSRLIERDEFEEMVSAEFAAPFTLPQGRDSYAEMLFNCQKAFLLNMKLGNNIAHNTALRENVFMMAVCVELRIPLFVVGKPGSSKSLAKSIVAESMKDRANPFLKQFKSVKLISYQCSKLSTPESIIDVFKSAQNIQTKLGHESNIALVVLDEVGLAEDSPSMPLKALHPLLEDGTDGADPRELKIVDREERVAFIGISNWALDPAKMNRGIMVRRGKPDVEELVRSARGICSNEQHDPIKEYLEPIMESLAQAYLEIVEEQVGKRKEFFGLRDYYSLIKMLYWLIKNNDDDAPLYLVKDEYVKDVYVEDDDVKSGDDDVEDDDEDEYVEDEHVEDDIEDDDEEGEQVKRLYISKSQLEHAILRNFGGSDELRPLEAFKDCFDREDFSIVETLDAGEPDCTRMGLIKASLSSKDRSWHGENRYLLFLTENNAALQILSHFIEETKALPQQPHLLFGSSFPRDKDYTQICRTINQIKICMETGRPVVLLNLENLYESLYDVLNQYYTEVQGKRYVDLGLQTHRIKCRVHDDFKLILIAEKDKVYEKFPIPLINRLEKHLVMMSTILDEPQQRLCEQLKEWIQKFASIQSKSGAVFKPGDAFIGYQPETPAAVVLHAVEKLGKTPETSEANEEMWSREALTCCQHDLIQMACPDALARLKSSELEDEAEQIWEVYFNEQKHTSLSDLIQLYISTKQDLVEESESSFEMSYHSQESVPGLPGSLVELNVNMGLLLQVTTHSQPLAPVDIYRLCNKLGIGRSKEARNRLLYFYLEELDAEADFTDRIRKHFESVTSGDAFVIVQCSSGHLNKDIISCARHKAIDELQNFSRTPQWTKNYVPSNGKIHIIFIVSLPKTPGGSKFISFQGGKWLCVHLDDLRSQEDSDLGFLAAVKSSLSELVYSGHSGVEPLHKRLNSCIQNAVAKITDQDYHGSTRKIELLKTLLELVPSNGNADREEHTFYSVLVRRICRLIEQNEAQLAMTSNSDWAVREALNAYRLQEGGTFVNTLLKRIDSKLTEHLTGIIEYVDQNDNLRLLQNTFLRDLWLQIFDNDQLCRLSVDSSLNNKQNLLRRTGTLGAVRIPCKVPFSWLILSGLEAMWTTFVVREREPGSVVDDFSAQVQASHLGSMLSSVDSRMLPELADMYLDDFLAAVVQYSDKTEQQVLKSYLQTLSTRTAIDEARNNVLRTFVSYHVWYHLKEQEFIQYKELGTVFESTHQLVLSKLTASLEEPLDLFTVSLLMSHLKPRPVTDKEFWKVENIRVYVKKLQEGLNIINGIVASPADKSAILADIRRTWQKIRAVEMFICHLILPLPDNEEITKGAFRLWTRLDRNQPLGFSSLAIMDHCLKILKSVDDCVAKMFGLSDKKSRLALFDSTGDVKHCDRDKAYLRCFRALKMYFLEMVSVLSFGSGSYAPPDPDLTQSLMQRVLGETGTKELTPLDWEEPDQNPVVRSVLLQLLLLGSNDDVGSIGEMITQFISKSSEALQSSMGQESTSSVCALVVRCLEDKVNKEHHGGHRALNLVAKIEAISAQFEKSVKSYASHESETPATFEWLYSIAQLRDCMFQVADILVKYCQNEPQQELFHNEKMMLNELVELLSSALCRPQLQDITLYLTKQIVRRCGSMDCLLKIYNQDERYMFVLPSSFNSPETFANTKDTLVVCGGTYLSLRRAIMQSSVDDSMEPFRDAAQAIHGKEMYCYILTLFNKVFWPAKMGTVFSEKMLGELAGFSAEYLKKHPLLGQVYAAVCEDTIGGGSGLMKVSQSASDRTLTTLVLHAVTVILNSVGQGFKVFQDIIANPAKIEGKWLPGMPEDPLLQAETVMRFDPSQRRANYGKLYKCPNGHPYLIDQCTNPEERSTCNTCKAPIGKAPGGGLAEGNTAVQSDPRKEIGYVLGHAANRDDFTSPERGLCTPLSCAVTRFFLHVCYLWSSCHSDQASLASLKQTVYVSVEDLPTFFWEHVKKDIQEIHCTLSRGRDEVIMFLHEKINNLSGLNGFDADSSLASKGLREQWENAFYDCMFRQLEEPAALIQRAIDCIRKDAEEGDAEEAEDELFLAVYEKSGSQADICKTLWTYRPRVTLQTVLTALQTTDTSDGSHNMLLYFLEKAPLLRALQYLPDVIQLQKILLAAYSRNADLDDVRNTSIGAALKRVANTDEELAILKTCFSRTRTAWKLVRNSLLKFSLHPLSQEVISAVGDMDDRVPLAYLLPRESGPGLCSMALSVFLCLQQTWLLEECRRCNPARSYKNKVDLTQVQPFHMVSYESEIDAVVLTHCRYSLKFGQGEQLEYAFTALQKHIYDRFIVGKPTIEQGSQPMMVFTSDVVSKETLDQLRERVKPQVELSSEEQLEVVGRLKHDIAVVSTVLQTVTTAMGFLAADGSPPDMELGEYLKQVLKIKKRIGFFNKYSLKHILSLWETLAVYKSKQHSLSGSKVPFDGMSVTVEGKLEALSDATKGVLAEELKKFNLELFMNLLFKYIQMRLPFADDNELGYGLSESLSAYIGEIGDDTMEETLRDCLDRLQDVQVKQAVDVWNLTVRCQHDLQAQD